MGKGLGETSKAAAFQIDMQEFLFIGILGILRRCKAMQQFTAHRSSQ